MRTTWKSFSKKTKLTFLLSLTFLFLFSGSVYGGDFEDGSDAFPRKDYKEAFRLFTLSSAQQDNKKAQYVLGVMYYNGLGIPQDYKKAFIAYALSARQGVAEAQYELGEMYKKGEGIPQDYKAAVKMYRYSAQQGFAKAQLQLGKLYQDGNGIPQDYQEAVKWYRYSAEQGNALAQSTLGLMYLQGKGVLQDYVLGHMWFNLSSSNGSKFGVEGREIAEKRMTPSQIEEVQRLARNWKPKK
tara:strand:+ start:227 stop:949 length:723 start_codon:yes stop_codon:yes gene_type:complete